MFRSPCHASTAGADRLPTLFGPAGLVALALFAGSPAAAQDIPPGFFLSETSPPPTTTRDFASMPIPADFFGPGSDPFDGQVVLQGVPRGTDPFCPDDFFPGTDTIIQRLGPALLPGIPSTDVVPIEMVALSLASTAPITVTYAASGPELWDLHIDLSTTTPSTGTMVITREHVNGGVFQAELYVFPVLTFTRVPGGEIRVWDLGVEGTPDFIEVFNVPWVDSMAPPSSCTGNICVDPGNIWTWQGSTVQHGLLSFCPLDSSRDVQPGHDLFATEALLTSRNFAADPIPADFFGPGSDPFDGVIDFAGDPPSTFPACPFDDLTNVDTILHRPVSAILPSVPSSDQIPIEIVDLSLVSAAPIIVTYGGMPSELWDVEMSLSPLVASTGVMDIMRLVEDGGTATLAIDLVPLFTFTLHGGTEVRTLDYGVPSWSEPLSTAEVPWSYATGLPPGSCRSNFCLNPGGVMELQGPAMTHGLASLCDPVVSVAGGPVTASALHLSPCRPNPTRGPAWIGFTIPARLAGRPIRLDVHDVTGRRVRTLIDAPGVMGPQGVSWDGKDASGQPVAGGVYFMRLSVADESVTGRIVQLR